MRQALGAGALALALAGCSALTTAARSVAGGAPASAYAPADPKLAAPNPAGGPMNPFLADGRNVRRALDAVRAKVGRLRVTRLEADQTNGLSVQVQEPAHHVNVDQYVVASDGTLTGPEPVKLMSMNGKPVTAADVDAEAFDPYAIGLANLTPTIRAAIAASHASDARVIDWEFFGTARDARRYVYLTSARARPVATLDAHMKLAGVSF